MPFRALKTTLLWRTLLGLAAALWLLGFAAPVHADAPEVETYKLYKTLITKTLGASLKPCSYPLHLVFMLDTADGMRGTAQEDVQWALTKLGAEFLTAQDRLTIYNFDTAVHLAPGEVKTFKDEERFGGLLTPLLTKVKQPAKDIYLEPKSVLLRQANLIREKDTTHLVVAIMITHKIYGGNEPTPTRKDSAFEQPYEAELKKFLKGEGDMQAERITRPGKNQKEIAYDVLWAMEGGANSKRKPVGERYKVLLEGSAAPAFTSEKSSPKTVYYVVMAACLATIAGCAWRLLKRFQNPISVKTAIGRELHQEAITWERREIRIYACETGARRDPNDIYLNTFIKEPNDALKPKHLLTLTLSEGFTGKWKLTKKHPEVLLFTEKRHEGARQSVILKHQKRTRLYLELRNGVEIEMDFTPGRDTKPALFSLGLASASAAILFLVLLTLSQQTEPPSEPLPPPVRESVCP